MALGPKELGSWANDSNLSTEIRAGNVGKSRKAGTEELLLLRTSGARAKTRTSGIWPYRFRVLRSSDGGRCVWGLRWEKGWVSQEWWFRAAG